MRVLYGKLPVAGIPRLTRPRKRFGTVYGFSLVDVGGNWLRVSRAGDEEATAAEAGTGLAKVIDVAARLGDAKGDDAAALSTLQVALSRYPDAPAIDRARALLYQAELALRVGDHSLAQSALSEALSLDLEDQDRQLLAPEIAHTAEIVREAEGKG